MKKLISLLTATLFILSVESQAQITKGRINGTVVDGSAKTIESATITLLRLKDSSAFVSAPKIGRSR